MQILSVCNLCLSYMNLRHCHDNFLLLLNKSHYPHSSEIYWCDNKLIPTAQLIIIESDPLLCCARDKNSQQINYFHCTRALTVVYSMTEFNAFMCLTDEIFLFFFCINFFFSSSTRDQLV